MSVGRKGLGSLVLDLWGWMGWKWVRGRPQAACSWDPDGEGGPVEHHGELGDLVFCLQEIETPFLLKP